MIVECFKKSDDTPNAAESSLFLVAAAYGLEHGIQILQRPE